MKISVAMATYNGATFLKEQLQSLAYQTHRPDELIVTDDGSTDATIAILDEFSKTSPFQVRIFQGSVNQGVAANFGRAISLTTGDIIFLCDQDDFWFPEKIKWMSSQLMKKPNIQCLMCDAQFTDAKLQPRGGTKKNAIKNAGLAEEHFVMGCCVAARRSLINLSLPMLHGEKSHDNWIVGLSDMLGTTQRTNSVMQLYRIHGNNTSDFFVNRADPEKIIERIGRMRNDLVRKLGNSSLVTEYMRLTQFRARLEERELDLASIVGAKSAASIIEKMKDREAMLGARLEIQRSNIFLRPKLMISARKIGYVPNAFQCLKDLLWISRKEVK